MVTAAWRRAWDRVIPFFPFPPEVRRVIYTTNAIESVHSRLRKIIKTRGHFPSGEAASKPIWLALRNITAEWSRAAKEWKLAMNQFAILHEERFAQVAHGAGRCRRVEPWVHGPNRGASGGLALAKTNSCKCSQRVAAGLGDVSGRALHHHGVGTRCQRTDGQCKQGRCVTSLCSSAGHN